MSLLFTRQKIDIPPEIVYLSRENVVMHVSSRPHPNRSLLRTAFGQDMSDTIDAASSITQTGNLPLKTFTIADHDSPFSHMRISTPNDGKVDTFACCVGFAILFVVSFWCFLNAGKSIHASIICILLILVQEHYPCRKIHTRRRIHVDGEVLELEWLGEKQMAFWIQCPKRGLLWSLCWSNLKRYQEVPFCGFQFEIPGSLHQCRCCCR